MRLARRRNHKRLRGPRFLGRLSLMLAAFGVWLVLPVPALTAFVPSAARPPANSGLPWLSVVNQRIVDPAGRTVMLRGFNDDALLESTMHPAPLDEADARIMQASGFDVVRLPIAWSLLEPERGHFNENYLDTIASAVSLLNAHGMYVVLDMHFLGWSPAYGGSGAPAWATVEGLPDPIWGPMPSIGRFLSPAINISTAYFWVTSEWQGEFLKTWRLIAQRFRANSGVAGYDIINEPHSFPLPPLRFDKDQLFPFYSRAIEAIGHIDPNHLFFLDNDMAGDLPTSVVPISAPNLVYAAHIYTGSLIPPAFAGDPQPISAHMDELAQEAGQVPAPLWMGEFSINTSQTNAPAYVNAILNDFDDRNAGWAWWQWRETAGWGIRSGDGTSLNKQFLRLLARPYVVAAPSGVSAGHGDGIHGSLIIHVAAGHGQQAIVVAWPNYTLGTPRVAGDCALQSSWDPVRARLTLALGSPGACAVELSRSAQR